MSKWRPPVCPHWDSLKYLSGRAGGLYFGDQFFIPRNIYKQNLRPLSWKQCIKRKANSASPNVLHTITILVIGDLIVHFNCFTQRKFRLYMVKVYRCEQ
jgi:hypothetical protein